MSPTDEEHLRGLIFASTMTEFEWAVNGFNGAGLQAHLLDMFGRLGKLAKAQTAQLAKTIADLDNARRDAGTMRDTAIAVRIAERDKAIKERDAARAELANFDALARRCADALADEVAVLVRTKIIDARSPAADALLDYRNPPSTERADRLADLTRERDQLHKDVARLADELTARDAQ